MMRTDHVHELYMHRRTLHGCYLFINCNVHGCTSGKLGLLGCVLKLKRKEETRGDCMSGLTYRQSHSNYKSISEECLNEVSSL